MFLLVGKSALKMDDAFLSKFNTEDGLSQSLYKACEDELKLTPEIVKHHYVKVSAVNSNQFICLMWRLLFDSQVLPASTVVQETVRYQLKKATIQFLNEAHTKVQT